jgi:hypothetical protein
MTFSRKHTRAQLGLLDAGCVWRIGTHHHQRIDTNLILFYPSLKQGFLGMLLAYVCAWTLPLSTSLYATVVTCKHSYITKFSYTNKFNSLNITQILAKTRSIRNALKVKVKVKVKFTLEQAMNARGGVKI